MDTQCKGNFWVWPCFWRLLESYDLKRYEETDRRALTLLVLRTFAFSDAGAIDLRLCARGRNFEARKLRTQAVAAADFENFCERCEEAALPVARVKSSYLNVRVCAECAAAAFSQITKFGTSITIELDIHDVEGKDEKSFKSFRS